MGRSYAGILGSLAFATVVFRAALMGSGVEATCATAALAMTIAATAGFLLGSVAEMAVNDSVRAIVQAQIQPTETGQSRPEQRPA
ncbi:MAG: hypothetical protein K1X74_15280 [Pirellulales bacterium]|nr:hypothetical protein [Pirellulales bacterium]